MKATRLTGIPIAHITAELAAFPLASHAAFERATSALHPEMKDGTGDLWREAERTVVRTLPGLSIEEAVAIRDRIWFGNGADTPSSDGRGRGAPRTLPLAGYLRQIARDHLKLEGVVAVPALSQDENRPVYEPPHSREALARWRWRWLSLALPPDLLLAALPPIDGLTPLRVDSVSSLIDRQLADGHFSENHVHLGAALDFPLLWVLTQHALADPQTGPTEFSSPGAEFDEGLDFGPWLIRAAVFRYLLAASLATQYAHAEGFRGFLAGVVRQRLQASTAGDAAWALLLQGLGHLQGHALRGTATPPAGKADFFRWQSLFRLLTGLAGGALPDERTAALLTDPTATLLPSRYPEHETAETRFIVAALGYLGGPAGGNDMLFARVFWQVVRVRALYYRHLVQRPMTPGLQWFIRFYSRLRPARSRSGYGLRLGAAAEVCGWQRGLTSLEVRTSPERSASKVLAELRQMSRIAAEWRRVDEARQQDRLQFGVLYHFSKDRGGKALDGYPYPNWRNSHADPRSNANRTGCYRYAGYYREKEREALALIWVLRNLPAAAELVRGVDVCTDEMGVPFWVLAPLLRAVRAAGDEAVRKLQVQRCIEVPPLRTSVHAGEDFVHLLTGLRHIDEAIQLFELKEGDRLGHAMALGVDAADWALRAGRIAMTREVRLFDLAWEWQWYRRTGVPVPKRRRTLLEGEIARLSEEIFHRRCDFHDLVALVEMLNTPARLWAIGFPDGPLPVRAASCPSDDGIENGGQLHRRRAEELFRQYLTCAATFGRGRVVEWVDPEIEGEVLADIQSGIRHNINNRGFTIEVNPSSNLLIGDLGDLARHPLWRLNPPQPELQSGPPLAVCIGSDDPLTFGTSLPYEYQLVFDALILSGVSAENARTWLKNAQQRGLDARFTLPKRNVDNLLDLRSLPSSTGPLLMWA